jgi:hypothetical protein
VHAREHLHQGRLAGAVLAHDGVDLARAQVEIDAVQDFDAHKALGDPPHLKEWRRVPLHITAPYESFRRLSKELGGLSSVSRRTSEICLT